MIFIPRNSEMRPQDNPFLRYATSYLTPVYNIINMTEKIIFESIFDKDVFVVHKISVYFLYCYRIYNKRTIGGVSV